MKDNPNRVIPGRRAEAQRRRANPESGNSSIGKHRSWIPDHAFGVSGMTLLLLLLFVSFAHADPAPLTASKIVSGDEIQLSDGRTLKPQAITAPDNDAARDGLAKLVADKPLDLENAVTDRYGRTQAVIFVIDGKKKIWLQGEMLKAGLAFVYPPAGNEPYVDGMLKLESAARSNKTGIWADPAFADTDAAIGTVPYGRFVFMRGKVLKAERVKNKFYLNFGDDWRQDFTVSIAAHDLHLWKKAGIDPADYEGKLVRVRGWIRRDGGPMIAATDPAQIEILAAR